ncbi:ATP-binding cassette domain-containing protein [Furfurilactobacillus sp. WILCCON 0119]|uniref:ATP-binding cassette domain-containing protein n=1 Tax=Furfurilactobacillus entadae TaxID=2922307 RepID=UPI0035EEB104
MALTITNISKTSGKTSRLKNINLNFEAGQIYGLLGRNGAGKSTLLNIIADRLPASRGQVTIDGTPVHERDKQLQRLYLMSEDNLYPGDRRVRQLFDLTAQFYGTFDRENADRLANVFGLDVNARFRNLSTGYRTIFKDIVALCVPVDYVLLDEPVLGLDANHRSRFYDELMASYVDRPRTFIISTHLVEEIEHLLNGVVVIADGKIKVAEQVETLMATAVQLSGPADVMAPILETVTVLAQHQFAKQTTAIVMVETMPTLPTTVTQQALNLQALFVALTEDEHEI